MKALLLILALSVATSAQLICVNNDGSPVLPVNRSISLTNGKAWSYDLFMPVAGTCVGYFSAYDASDDLNRTAAKALSTYVDRPAGDIQILILDYPQYLEWQRERSHSPIYNSRPQERGKFAVDLNAGYYKLVISNRHSKFAPKTVDLMIGNPAPKKKTTRKRLAP